VTSSGNPLWGVPLKELSDTRERPIFSPTRRPPPPVVAAPAPVAIAPPPPPPKPAEPEQPNFALLGTIVNGEDGYAIFFDRGKKQPVRVRIGAAYDGWILRNLKSGVAVVMKSMNLTTLSLPKRSGDQGKPPNPFAAAGGGLLQNGMGQPLLGPGAGAGSGSGSAFPVQFPQQNPMGGDQPPANPFGQTPPSPDAVGQRPPPPKAGVPQPINLR
jgi:hypothetical protein